MQRAMKLKPHHRLVMYAESFVAVKQHHRLVMHAESYVAEATSYADRVYRELCS